MSEFVPIGILRDDDHDIVTIEGMRYACEFFREFARDLPVNVPFSIFQREDGVVTIRKLPEGKIARDGPAPWKGGSNYRAENAPSMPARVLLLLKGASNSQPNKIDWWIAERVMGEHENEWAIETNEDGVLDIAYDNPMIVAWAPLPEVEA